MASICPGRSLEIVAMDEYLGMKTPNAADDNSIAMSITASMRISLSNTTYSRLNTTNPKPVCHISWHVIVIC